ncbi:MAG: bifunctional (p)ppGpp synthetase/guanosine-3',5'-bis(diphosphate) 3'-pyrophosphohydrolase [Alphaproteobacteria bacterium]|nr:bifunctional (p)ppGpp synthetase/guanosine-3',5'-bis(diphosphate) 3'-pyrophosphohydrolase [Alphaproteobacteria bacterium]
MMRQFELVEKVKAYDPEADEDLLNRAYVFGIKAHGNQKRDSGDPYFSHPLEVAGILTDLKLDDATIVTALLHDTIEDTGITHEDIEKQFGREIADLVNGVTKLSKLELQSEETKQAENFRKFMLAMSHDVRVLLVKLADRVHNMRTLKSIKNPDRRKRIATETMEIYAPLAGRMGMQTFRDELEDLAFAEINSEMRTSILKRLESLKSESGAISSRIAETLKRKLADYGIDSWVSGREKKAYSIWRKMEEKRVTFDQLSDIFALRVVVGTVEDCYRALGIIHQSWRHVPGRFKDYISLPKTNNYRSLHTEIFGPENQRIELQIRTTEMHEIAERGIAAHWSYKDKLNGGRPLANIDAYESLRSLIESLKVGNTPEEFLEHTRLELFQDQVFCFTPKGKLIALPRGATPIDFAYAVHTEVGDTCVGAKVNGRHVPLATKLKNGESVEIIRSPKQGPSAIWEEMVVTGKARASIKKYLKNAEKIEHQRMGRAILEKAFRDAGQEFSEKSLTAVLKKMKLMKADEVYALLGQGVVTPVEVMKSVFPGLKVEASLLGWTNWMTRKPKGNAIPIEGLAPGLGYHLAPCCQPLTGDRIIGVITHGHGVMVHTADCERLADFQDQPDRWVDLKWSPEATEDVQTGRLKISVNNEAGALANMCNAIARHDGNITNLKIVGRAPLVFDMLVDVEVRDAKHLANIITGLRASPSINGVDRPHGERELTAHDA